MSLLFRPLGLFLSLVPLALSAGSLDVSFSHITAGSVIDLTAEGTTDWVHWGLFTETSIDRKANVAPRISDFTPVDASNGYVYIYQFGDNANGYSWNDGTPHMNVTNTTTGVWAYGVPATGSGFRFSVPASTNAQTLKVYVGAFAAEGRFVAFLSDGSAANYTNGANSAVRNISNGPSGVYTINFAANSPGQTLNILYTLKTPLGAGNVTLQSAALSAPGMNNLPFVALTNPLDRASFSSSDTIALSATAGDADGTISAVEFYAGSNKIGEATSAPYSVTWPNPEPGVYTLTARALDNAGGVGISSPVTVFVNGPGGTISGSRNNSAASVNLTDEGTSDWAHWGSLTASSFDYKATGNFQIRDVTPIGSNAVARYDDNFTAFSWSDGVPLTATNGSTTGIYVTGLGNGFEISAPADTNQRTLKVYVGLYGAQANFDAFLSDFSGRAYTDTSLSNVFGNRYVVYTIDYAAASSGQRLIVRQTLGNIYDFKYGNVTLQAATLQIAAPPASNAPPVVTITNPSSDVVFPAPATFPIEAIASDPDGSITQVEFFNGAESIGVDAADPFGAAVTDLPPGIYVLSAVATDNGGAKATNSISITVNALPTVTISTPTNNATFNAPATITIEATANDSDGSVTNVQFFAGETLLGASDTTPFSITVTNVMAGLYTLTAKAFDNLGAFATSAPVSVTLIASNSPSAPIIADTHLDNGMLLFTFGTEAGSTYTVESTSSLNPMSWQTVTNFVANGATATITNPLAGTEQFYRVKVD
jgi:hypothetical protein